MQSNCQYRLWSPCAAITAITFALSFDKILYETTVRAKLRNNLIRRVLYRDTSSGRLFPISDTNYSYKKKIHSTNRLADCGNAEQRTTFSMRECIVVMENSLSAVTIMSRSHKHLRTLRIVADAIRSNPQTFVSGANCS